jgi:hypothetical protein
MGTEQPTNSVKRVVSIAALLPRYMCMELCYGRNDSGASRKSKNVTNIVHSATA